MLEYAAAVLYDLFADVVCEAGYLRVFELVLLAVAVPAAAAAVRFEGIGVRKEVFCVWSVC